MPAMLFVRFPYLWSPMASHLEYFILNEGGDVFYKEAESLTPVNADYHYPGLIELYGRFILQKHEEFL